MPKFATDFAIFGTLIVVLIMVSRDQSWGIRLLRPIAKGLFQNPMIVSFSLGIFWGYSDYQTPKFFSEFLVILGQAATPGALFAIGASLSFRKIDDPKSAFWLSFLKLVAHPFLVGITASIVNPKIILFFTSVFSQFIKPEMIFIEKIYIAFLAFLIDVTWYILVSVFIQHSLSKFIKKNISIFMHIGI